MMRLNDMKPGSRKAPRRVGRGRSSGWGKTCGRGQKGQKSRSGGYHKVGFEGGQMPLQRRLPKVGFNSRVKKYRAEVRLGELGLVDGVVDLDALKKARIISRLAEKAKVIDSGKIEQAVTVRGLKVTPGARRAIEAAGGTIEE